MPIGKTSRLFAINFLGLFGDSLLKTKENDPPTEIDRTGSKETSPTSDQTLSQDHKDAIQYSSKRAVNYMLEKGIPGMTICVSKRGRIVWHSAFGFCDVENHLECKPEARMRIASISKSLFAATVIAPMIDQGQLDIKSSIYRYLKPAEFPRKTFDGKEVDITIEQLLSHTSGIKSYDINDEEPRRPIGSQESLKIYQCDEQFDRVGFYQRKTYRNVIEALEPIRDEPLAREPGNYGYTTYGYTLLSAVVEKIHQQRGGDDKTKKEQIEDFWSKTLRKDWDLTETCLDQDEVLISNRARYYLRKAYNGGLINAPYTDNSVKWAGGGINSSVKDLVKFGNALIDSYKMRNNPKIERQTIDLLWTEVQQGYGLGFRMTNIDPGESGEKKKVVYHLGNAVGASSGLFIYPEDEIVVAILTNMGSLGLLQIGCDIGNRFAKY